MTPRSTAPTGSQSTARQNTGSRNRFHTVRVAEVHALCDDAAAITFDVPAELAAEFDFLPGQSLTLRRRDTEGEHRRSYSICAARGARPRVGVREVPGGLSFIGKYHLGWDGKAVRNLFQKWTVYSTIEEIRKE